MAGSKKGKNSLVYKIAAAVLAVIAAAVGAFLKTGKTPDVPDIVSEIAGEVSSVIREENENGTVTEVAADSTVDIEAAETENYSEQYSAEVSTESEYEYYLTFANDKLLKQHYEKHGKEMGFDSPEEYEAAANDVVYNSMTMHKTEAEDGDDVYYLESTNEFVIVSTYGYIRTYFQPADGLAYYNRQ